MLNENVIKQSWLNKNIIDRAGKTFFPLIKHILLEEDQQRERELDFLEKSHLLNVFFNDNTTDKTSCWR